MTHVGSCASFRDGTGGQIPGTSFSALNIGSTLQIDHEAFTNGGTYIQFDIDGDFFLEWSYRYNDTSNGRANYQAKAVVSVGSGILWTTWKTGYNRNSSNPYATVHGMAWYRATAGDRIEIHHRRDADTPTGGTVANRCSLTAVRMWDPLAYGIYHDSSDTSRFQGTTPISVPFADIDLESDTSSIEQISSTVFRLKNPTTRYLIGYGVSGAQYTPSTTRTQRVSQVAADGVATPYGDSYCFQRNSDNEYAGLGAVTIYRTENDPVDIEIQAWRGDGVGPLSPGGTNAVGGADSDGAWERVASEGGLLIAEIPSHVHTFLCHDDPIAAQGISSGTTDLHIARNVDHLDPSWKRGDTHYLVAQRQHRVFLFGNIRTARVDVLDATRGQFNGRIRKNSGALTAGDEICYTRGYEPIAGSTFGGGFNPMVIGAGIGVGALEIGDIIGIRTVIEGEAGADGTLTACMGGMNIDTFINRTYGSPKGQNAVPGSAAGDSAVPGSAKGQNAVPGAPEGDNAIPGSAKGQNPIPRSVAGDDTYG